MSDRTLVAATIAHAESTLGLMGLWINNAVIMPTVRFSDQPIELSRAIIELDYVSVVEATRAILPVTLARRTKHRQDRNGRKNPPRQRSAARLAQRPSASPPFLVSSVGDLT